MNYFLSFKGSLTSNTDTRELDWTNHSKWGPTNYEAFLTKEGKKILQDLRKNFELTFLMKEPDSYVFISEADNSQKLSRETIPKDVNKVMRQVFKELPD